MTPTNSLCLLPSLTASHPPCTSPAVLPLTGGRAVLGCPSPHCLTLVFSLPKTAHTVGRQGDGARAANMPVTWLGPLLGKDGGALSRSSRSTQSSSLLQRDGGRGASGSAGSPGAAYKTPGWGAERGAASFRAQQLGPLANSPRASSGPDPRAVGLNPPGSCWGPRAGSSGPGSVTASQCVDDPLSAGLVLFLGATEGLAVVHFDLCSNGGFPAASAPAGLGWGWGGRQWH